MKTILVIGMGRFGRHLSHKLLAYDNEVMVVDKNEERLSVMLGSATNAQIGDCTNEEVLRSLGVRNFDICFVCVGTDFQSSLEITALLKELGAKHVISKATSEIHAKFLLKNGADEVTYPERDIAEKLAVRHSTNNLFDYIKLTKEISIYEIPPLDAWIGKTIREADVRAHYNVSILAVTNGDKVTPMPSADHVFSPDEHLMVIGHHHDVEKILKKN